MSMIVENGYMKCFSISPNNDPYMYSPAGATYEAEREAEGYGTKVFYRVDAEDVDAPAEDITTVYHIKAVVTYKLLGE